LFFDILPEGGFVCGHRGARSIAPENTILSLQKAKDCGASCWETDIRMSRDEQLIIFHDDTLERTTDVATCEIFRNRLPWNTDQLTAAELQKLDSGSWFLNEDPFGTVTSGEVVPGEQETIRGQKIPLLTEVLEFTRTHRFPVNLEIKDLRTPPGDVTIVDRVMALLRETDTMDLVLISSFRHEYLYRARALSKKIALGVLAEKNHPPDLPNYLGTLSAAAYHPEKDICDLSLVRELLQAGFRVNTWTVNDMARAGELLQAGAGVITDWPQCLTCRHRRIA